jgi:hypothetical protein
VTRSPRVALVLPLLVLAGCAATAPAPAPAAAPPPAPAAAGTATGPLAPPQLEFVNRLAEIQPALAEIPERSIGRGENICADLEHDAPADKLAADAAERFSGAGVELTPADGAKIVEAARGTLCVGG